MDPVPPMVLTRRRTLNAAGERVNAGGRRAAAKARRLHRLGHGRQYPVVAMRAGATRAPRPRVAMATLTSAPPPPRRSATLLEAHDARVEPIWRTLEAAARPTYFLTWGWIETWLAALPHDAMP